MAIKVNGTTVINDSRALTNIASVDATTAAAIGAAGVGGGPTEILSSGSGTMTSLSFTNLDFYAYSYRLVLRGIVTELYGGTNNYCPVVRFSNNNLSSFTTVPFSVVYKEQNNQRISFLSKSAAPIGTTDAFWTVANDNVIELRMSGSDVLGTGGGMMGSWNAINGTTFHQRGYFNGDGGANSFKIQSSWYTDPSNLYGLVSIAKYVLYRTATS